MTTSSNRCTAVMVAAIAASLLVGGCTGSSPAPPGGAGARARHAPGQVRTVAPNVRPSARPWLEVRLPPPPAAGAATARLELKLADRRRAPSDYAGFRVSIGGAATREVPTGDRAELVVAAGPRQPLRLEIGGIRVLAHVHAGDTLAVQDGHDGGWIAVIGNRMPENAPKKLTVCGRSGATRPSVTQDDCAAGYLWTRVYDGDPVCPVRAGDDVAHKCVKAPVVRARGPLSGRAEVSNASASGQLDELDTVPLAPRPLAASAAGPWIAVAAGSEAMPTVRLGDATALLVVGPGQSCEVWLDDQGRVDSAELAPK